MCRGLMQHGYGYMRLSMPPHDCPHVAVFQPCAAGARRGRQCRCCWVGLGDRAHHSAFQQSRVHGHDCRSVKLSITSLFPDSVSREGGFPAASVHAQSRRSLCSALHICWSANNCGTEHNKGDWKDVGAYKFLRNVLVGVHVHRNLFS